MTGARTAVPTGDDVAALARSDETLLRYAVLLTGRREEAEDLLHDAALRILGNQKAGAEIAHLRAYMRRTITTIFLDQSRRRRRWTELLPRIAEPQRHSDAPEAVVLRRYLDSHLRRLSGTQRAAVVMHYYLDLPFSEVAATLECSEATARSAVSRALARLRVTIEGEEGP